ncbi:MAG: emopamil-binding family protein [Myxococcota bacterium]
MNETVPLSKRPQDVVILVFFWINILFITYIVDLEQLVIADPNDFEYPLWPPGPLIDLVHWWARNFDPVILARPVWWKVTIWIDALFFGPFYVFAIYAYTKGREWIRIPSIIYASVMLTNVSVILGEEIFGAHATPELAWILLANGPWVLVPLFILYRMGTAERPFSRPTAAAAG